MKRLASGLGVLGALILITPVFHAQAQQGPGGAPQLPPPTNLKILPKNISNADLREVMEGFTQALGVGCNYCHVLPRPPAAGAAAGGGPGGPPPNFRPDPKRFALDDKAEKKTTRLMMKMVHDLNTRIDTEVAPVLGRPTAELTRVQCATCHRGVEKPDQITNILSSLALSQGQSAAESKYRELRTKYYGSQAYDFSDAMLVQVSETSLANNKVDDAMAWLKLNLEFYPNSSRTYVQMSQVYTRQADKDAAMQAAQKAVELDPNNVNAQRQLTQLKGAGAAGPGGRGGAGR